MIKKIYKYDTDNCVFLDELIIESKNEQQLHMIENDEGEMVFKDGVTDVAPPDNMPKYMGVSPRFDETTKTWLEDKVAVQDHVESLKSEQPISEKQRISDLESIISDLIMMNGGI